ncbi:hypothetical protein DES36_10963 [Alkalibaculum bacchi]|uniref:Uncharacterized protein n=1 Tax=Alkalibaculum bacchi TaxID=645887 RepID=A0A366I875_9FIRM|nr:hypothetical protein DES36_10963 [Alkalibaculum bacchi]
MNRKGENAEVIFYLNKKFAGIIVNNNNTAVKRWRAICNVWFYFSIKLYFKLTASFYKLAVFFTFN